MLTLFSIGAYAQTQQGQSSFGFNLGYNFNDVGNATIGIDYRYCVTDAFRLTPSITHLVKNDGLSAWAIDMNAHYVFSRPLKSILLSDIQQYNYQTSIVNLQVFVSLGIETCRFL